MVTLEINNQTDFKLPKEKLEKEAQRTLKKANLSNDYTISIGLVKKNTIRKINKSWRDENKEAGVLSFTDKEAGEDFYQLQENEFLGEIFLCPSYIKEKANQTEKKLEDEFIRYFKHGVLHLAGLSHDQMDKIEKRD